MRSLCCTVLAAVCLTGCFSAPKKREEAPLMSQRMASRFTKPDMSKRSIYEKSMQSSIGTKQGVGSWFSGKQHHAKSFTGGKSFAGTREVKTGGFAPAKQQSQMAREGFAQSDNTPSYGDKAFSAAQSRDQDKSAAAGSKTFSDAGAVFKTESQRDALKSQQKNITPTFVEFEEQSRTPAYSEQQVRRLMGRD